jgi:hypothetical protein
VFVRPHFSYNRLTDGGEVLRLTRLPPVIPRKIPGAHFRSSEEGERPPLEAATKQRLVKIEKTLCAVVTLIFGVCK